MYKGHTAFLYKHFSSLLYPHIEKYSSPHERGACGFRRKIKLPHQQKQFYNVIIQYIHLKYILNAKSCHAKQILSRT